ncbi:hypothetical protein ACOBQB_33740 [Streptomyces sp. G5(2025)]|uniref:hypothetical protein n=1 Tax=Streptomyces sp. G5(2025) TaxID=3406628 RepID=UPI003C1B04A9
MTHVTPPQSLDDGAGDILATQLAQAWHMTFGTPPDENSNFYEAGGQSIDAARMASVAAQSLPQVEDLDAHLMTSLLNEERWADVVRSGREFIAQSPRDPDLGTAG